MGNKKKEKWNRNNCIVDRYNKINSGYMIFENAFQSKYFPK